VLITIGIDPHKSSLTAAALDEHRRVLAQQRFAANRAGYRGPWQWARRYSHRQWAVERRQRRGAGRDRR